MSQATREMGMTKDQMKDLSGLFAQQATGTESFSNGIAPFTVQFGYVNEVCCHDGVRILDCPQSLLNAVIEWAKGQTPYVGVSIHNGALFVK
jgi:hypothetical protein